MASLPIVELIAQDIFGVLQTVNTTNGYSYDLVPERASMQGANPTHLLCILYQLDPDRNDSESNGLDGWIQPFAIDVFVIPSQSDTTPVDQYKNIIYAEIYQALMQDYSRSGYALDTLIHSPLHFKAANGTYDGFALQPEVTYRTVKDNPFQQ